MTFHVPNQYRIRTGRYGTSDGQGNYGAFWVRNLSKKTRQQQPLRVIASDDGGWEHVSVSMPERVPTWAEMCYVKALFWDAEDTVMQLHPPKSQWINNHDYCLHLWRPKFAEIPLPPGFMVGIPGLDHATVRAMIQEGAL